MLVGTMLVGGLGVSPHTASLRAPHDPKSDGCSEDGAEETWPVHNILCYTIRYYAILYNIT